VLAGLTVTAIPENMRAQLPDGLNGVYVSQVQPNTPVSDKIRVGDLILEIKGRPIASVQEYEAAAGELGAGDRALLRIVRGSSAGYVVVTP
jgi:S1-C subfamily serine protease